MKVLLSEEQLSEGVERLAAEINHHYGNEPLTIVSVLTGSVVLLADLIRLLRMPLRIGFVQARSYHGASTTPGDLIIHTDILPEMRDRRVLLIDDIFDTGHTLSRLCQEMRAMHPATLHSAVLLRKHGRKAVAMEPDYVAFEIPDRFVVGYGLDYQDEHRHLPYLAVLDDPAES